METNYESVPATPAEFEDYRIMPAWCAFVLGGVTTFLLVYLGIARPVAHELDITRRQMGALEQTVWEIAGTRDDVVKATSLLGELTAQRAQISKARLAVKDLEALRRQLEHESTHLQEALATVAELGAIKESLLSYAGEAQEAAEVVSATQMLASRLADSADSTYEALQASDDLLAMKDDLLASPELTMEAADSLSQLLDIRAQLYTEGADVAAAQGVLDDLLSLKSLVLAQQGEMVTTLETLEVMHDLASEFDQASEAFNRIRHWMVEIVASESILDRARHTLEPLTEIANLRHLEPHVIRELASRLTDRLGVQLAASPNRSVPVETASINETDLVVE